MSDLIFTRLALGALGVYLIYSVSNAFVTGRIASEMGSRRMWRIVEKNKEPASFWFNLAFKILLIIMVVYAMIMYKS